MMKNLAVLSVSCLVWVPSVTAFVIHAPATTKHYGLPDVSRRKTFTFLNVAFKEELCPTDTLGEGSLTTTFAEGTPEDDIVLSWEADVADRIRREFKKRPPTELPYMAAVIGNPGCGKTTSCFALSELLDDIGCLVVPFDGYHLPLDTLKEAANADDLIYRRGAPDTFDPASLKHDLHRMRHGKEPVIHLPGFDHAVGDPEPDAHEFSREQHPIVLCEGLYLLHDEGEWDSLKDLFDLKIFVSGDVDLCVERLKIRNKCIPGYTEEEIEIRCDVVDRVNAETVERSKQYADLIVQSAAERSITTTLADGTPESEIELSWEASFAAKIRQDLESHTSDEPYMVSLVGGPGCGKTTSCHVLKELLDDVGCLIMPFDGYHIPLQELHKHPNADDLVYRRGAPDTFDAPRLQHDLSRMRFGDEPVVKVPGFDHAHGDPEPDAHEFHRQKHRVVLCEGLYLLHDEGGWEKTKDLFDYSIFVDADVDTCIERLKVRNKCIPGYTEEEIEIRCEVVDRVNAMTVDKSKKYADMVVESVAATAAAMA